MTQKSLGAAFLQVAQAFPDGCAVLANDSATTYSEVARLARTYADDLVAHGAVPGDVVAIEQAPGPEFVAAAVAAGLVGAAYLPIGVRTRITRRRKLFDVARPQFTFRTDGLHYFNNAEGGTLGGSDPGYIIFTSGSTGIPKGVVVGAAGVHSLVAAFDRLAPLQAGTRCSWWTSPHFDVSIYELWSALLTGNTLVVIPDEVRADLDATLDFLAEHRIGSAYLPPQFLPELLRRACDGRPIPPLTRLLTGVEPVPLGRLVEIRRRIPGVTVINGYGPTEATVCATLYVVPAECADPGRRAPIGHAVFGSRVYIFGNALQPVPAGTPGELYVAGAGVAHGYLHDSELTRLRFIPDPHGPGQMYRTGDMVLANSAGELTFLGRTDDQVKINGVRIEPAEVEAVLRRVPGVEDIAVLAQPAGEHGPRVLTAYVVTPGGDLPVSFIRRLTKTVAAELPLQAVPGRFVALLALPMTPDGKLDRAALPRFTVPARTPRSDVEEMVSEICRELLPHVAGDVLGARFVALGGDSLLATRFAARLRTATGRVVGPNDILSASTLGALADGLQRRHLDEVLPEVEHRPSVEVAAPLNAGQIGILAASMYAPPQTFTESVVLELGDDLPANELAASLTRVLAKHAIVYARLDDETLELTTDVALTPVPVQEVSAGSNWREVLEHLRAEPFDLSTGPLVRSTVARLPDGRLLVLLVWHHLVIDAESMHVILLELAAEIDGRDDAIPRRCNVPVEREFAAYARRQAVFLDSVDGKARLATEAERVRRWLPDHPSGALAGLQSTGVLVSPSTWSIVSAWAREHEVTRFAVVLAALAGPLCNLANTDGRFALTVSDRDSLGAENATGYYLTTVPFGPRDVPSEQPDRAIRDAEGVLASARASAVVPFPSLMAVLGVRDAARVAPLVIAWDQDWAGHLRSAGWDARTHPVPPLAPRWCWTIAFSDAGDDGLTVRVEFPDVVASTEVSGALIEMEQQLLNFIDRSM